MSQGVRTIRRAFASRDPTTVARRQRARLAEMVAFARANSRYYRELYQDLPERIEDPRKLPICDKPKLMSRFDDWVTDADATLARVNRFIGNPELVGERLLGKYTALTTSGTTGTRGIFLLDQESMAVTVALFLRMMRAWFGFGDIARVLFRGWRMANVVATGGHFAAAVAAAQRPKAMRIFAVDTPLAELVDQINRFRPVVFGGYASTVALLAAEQEAGRLSIDPVLVIPIAEGLSPDEYDRIAKVFGAKVHTSYAATECPFLSYDCEHRWLHVNSDWVVLEPVTADYEPTPPGEQSHTVLISNLANRVQPILRYDLGDSILARPDRCPCGNPLPAIRVHGRSADLLSFTTEDGKQVSIPPLAFEIDHISGVLLYQVVQTAHTTLRVRLRVAPTADPDRCWEEMRARLSRLLRTHSLGHVTLERGEEPPERATGGKYRAVVPLR